MHQLNSPKIHQTASSDTKGLGGRLDRGMLIALVAVLMSTVFVRFYESRARVHVVDKAAWNNLYGGPPPAAKKRSNKLPEKTGD